MNLLILLVYLTLQLTHALNKRIVGGFSVDPHTAPYLVSVSKVQGDTRYVCGGTLISTRHVVTAAHCVVDKDTVQISNDDIFVGYGSQDRSKQAKANPHKVTVNDRYMKDKSRDSQYDIAIIELNKDLEISVDVQNIPIYTDKVMPGDSMVALGWGKQDNGELSQTLNGVMLEAGNKTACQRYNQWFTDNNGPQVCVVGWDTPGKSTCSGDSGSSVVMEQQGKIKLLAFDSIGVFANGEGCGGINTAHYFVNVFFHLSFITQASGLTGKQLTGDSRVSAKPPANQGGGKVPGEIEDGGTSSNSSSNVRWNGLLLVFILTFKVLL